MDNYYIRKEGNISRVLTIGEKLGIDLFVEEAGIILRRLKAEDYNKITDEMITNGIKNWVKKPNM